MCGLSEITEAYSAYLQSLPWDYFATVTFRTPRKDSIRAGNVVWKELAYQDVERAFLAVEPHESGDLHIHGLLKMPDNVFMRSDYTKADLRNGRAYDLWRTVFHKFGRSKVEVINDSHAVAEYCSKYVVKQSLNQDCYNFYGQSSLWKPDY